MSEKVHSSVGQRIIIKFLTRENVKPAELLRRLQAQFGNETLSWPRVKFCKKNLTKGITASKMDWRGVLLVDFLHERRTINAAYYCNLLSQARLYLIHPRTTPRSLSIWTTKKAVNATCDAWMRNNPGKTLVIYNIPSIIATALPIALTPSNIQAGFRCTGIFPYKRNIFTALDYSPSVTDRPAPLADGTDENRNI
ncbi:hypothetical protein NQ318_015296 [Aromia moschata]|uniref:Uncharacterized protein n=1 Tax=Aromia moschata TaxID=1265417 RepID=A0AAV8XFM6_9CUCU|nr:hypothetical protein NQ318_015296 [Aromia moschata]